MKILAFIITTTASLAAAVVWFLFMILGMNGYSGSDAEPGLLTYIVLAVLVSIIAGIGAYLLTSNLISRKFQPAIALLIVVPIFTTAAVIIEFVCAFVGIFVSEYVRTHR